MKSRAWAWILALSLATPAAAERLPFRVFTTADGLAGDAIRDLYRDSRGFLWIATSSGLSRFDGQAFRTYDTAEGLPSPRVNALAETADGTLWVGTSEGLARLRSLVGEGEDALAIDPGAWAGQRQNITFLAVDRQDRLWVGVGLGLAVREHGIWRRVDLPPGVTDTGAMVEDEAGAHWFSTAQGLVIRRPDGTWLRLPVRPETAGVDVMVRDRAGTLWIGRGDGLIALRSSSSAGLSDLRPLWERAVWATRPAEDRGAVTRFDHASGLVDDHLSDLALGPDDRLWIASRGGVTGWSRTGWRRISVAQGLPEASTTSVLEDADGTLWVGTESRGLARLVRSSLVSYGEADGLAGDRVTSLFEDPRGRLFAVTASRDLQIWEGERFRVVTPRMLAAHGDRSWGWNQYFLRDSRGRWWFPTGDGLYRFAPVSAERDLVDARPEATFSVGTGLPGKDVFRVYEDRQGDVWVSTISTPPLVRLIAGQTPAAVPEIRGPETGGAPSVFAEDRQGALWMGFYTGGLARRRAGAWQFFGAESGVPPGFVSSLIIDRKGGLWVGTTGAGIAHLADPAAESPRFVRFTSAAGLTTDSVRCLVEGADGSLYIGTPRGVDRFEPASGRVRNLSADEGLPNNLVWSCLAARDGSLWFGTLHGLSRLDPRLEPRQPAPQALLAGLRIRGRRYPLAELGAKELSGLVLTPEQSSLEVEFLAVALAAGSNVRFQYKLEGGGLDWSPPSRDRSVAFPQLAPGDYRLLVRARTRDGVSGASPAELSFRLLPPLWRRPWFMVLSGLVAAAAATLAHRARLGRMIALERVRTRIATDLHDDFGASLSRISLLGELAKDRIETEPRSSHEMLSTICEEARYLAEATSDLVWSVDPSQDDLRSLLVRLRRFAVDLLEAKGMRLAFEVPDDAAEVPLSPESRRGLYLMLKEAIHNVARHSGGRLAKVRVTAQDGALTAWVEDDGAGFEASARATHSPGGHGLPGLAARARALGGAAAVESRPGAGTRVSIRVPLA